MLSLSSLEIENQFRDKYLSVFLNFHEAFSVFRIGEISLNLILSHLRLVMIVGGQNINLLNLVALLF